MSSTQFRKVFLIGFAIAAMSLISATSNLNEQSQKEVLTVEVIITGRIQQMIVFQINEDAEVLALNVVNQRNIRSNGEIITSKFNELYQQGWELQGSSGGSEYQRYVFVK
jgi:hypothetical protein